MPRGLSAGDLIHGVSGIYTKDVCAVVSQPSICNIYHIMVTIRKSCLCEVHECAVSPVCDVIGDVIDDIIGEAKLS